MSEYTYPLRPLILARLCLCALMFLPSIASAHRDSSKITDTSWESSSASLAMTFTSKPGKIYEVQGSPDLAVFSQLTDVVGASVVAQTTVVEAFCRGGSVFF
jgi:hypothetical protein